MHYHPFGKKIPCLVLALLSLILASRLPAQTFLTLHNFSTVVGINTNTDGYYVYAPLILSGDTLYGTASSGGTNAHGTIFSLNTSGSNFLLLHTFSPYQGPQTTNSDGANPRAGLILSGGTLYGVASGAGANGQGTVFSLGADGSNFTTIYSFSARTNGTNSDGVEPFGNLVLSGNTLFGTTFEGGPNGVGTIFAVNTNGSNFINLHSFSKPTGSTNIDGENPYAGLVLSGNMLYGTAFSGGTNGRGTLFSLTTNGTNFTVLHTFSPFQGVNHTNNDGASPAAALLLSGNTLYGTASSAGANGSGALFAINTNGLGFTNFYSFSSDAGFENSDGAQPYGSLILSGEALYGTTTSGGVFDNGAVFTVNTNGMNFTNFHSFSSLQGADGINTGGAIPFDALVLFDGTLYGTANQGGADGSGAIFSFSLPQPQTPTINSITLSGTNLVINAAGGQSGSACVTLTSPTLALPFSQWTPIATNTLTASGNFTITATNAVNPTADQRFFLLQMQ